MTESAVQEISRVSAQGSTPSSVQARAEAVEESAGESARSAPPAGPPQLAAEVACLPLEDLFGWIEERKKSAFLRWTHRDHAKSLYFHQGEVVFASSNQQVDRLGECLLRAGVINLDQLCEAQRCFSPPARLGKVLVERGFLTPRELWNGVKYQVEEIVRSLFAYPGGRVEVWEGEVQPDNVVRLSLPSRRLVTEGLQRREELHKFLDVLEDPDVRLSLVSDSDAEVAGSEQALVDAIAEQGSFPAVCARLGFDRESAARSVQLLRLVGAVKLVRTQDQNSFVNPSDLEDQESEQVRETVTRMTKLVSELAGPIARAEGPEGIRDRLQRILEEAAGRFPDLLSGACLDESASLDPEPLIERALRLPGDREDQVIAGLGELVAYLEFEVKNHPTLDDPDALLEALGHLRP